MEIKACSYRNINFRYLESGQGDTLVFVGGAFQAIDKLGPLAEHWKNNYHFIAIELPGFGDSDYLDSFYDFNFTAECIAEVFEKENLRDALIVGTSYGAPSVFRFSLRHEHRLRGMVLGGACRSLSPFMEYQIRIMLWVLHSQNKEWMFPKAFTEVMCNTLAHDIPNSNRIQQIIMRSLIRLSIPARRKFIANSLRLLKERFPNEKTNLPTLAFTGEYDKFTPAVRLKEFEEICTNLRCVEIPNADHMYHLEQTDATLALIDQFHEELTSSEELQMAS